jgi:diketogulonate reductase-like aldo/keto reductase
MSKINIPQIKLYNGHTIPQFGLGVYLIKDNKECEKACLEAFKHGYRHIDTAHIYGNEKGVGETIKKSGIPREEFYITTKLWIGDFGEGKSLREVDQMLKRLDTNYIDLLLLHWPKGDYIGAYKDMEKAYNQGKVRSIGLSNFTEKQIEEIMSMCTVKPAIDQIELHPYGQRREVVDLCNKYNIKVEAWYPLAHGEKELLENPIFTRIGKKYNKTNAQVILRWHIQKGYIIFPRSRNPVHIAENINIFDFNLTKDEMDEIDSLDKQKLYLFW